MAWPLVAEFFCGFPNEEAVRVKTNVIIHNTTCPFLQCESLYENGQDTLQLSVLLNKYGRIKNVES